MPMPWRREYPSGCAVSVRFSGWLLRVVYSWLHRPENVAACVRARKMCVCACTALVYSNQDNAPLGRIFEPIFSKARKQESKKARGAQAQTTIMGASQRPGREASIDASLRGICIFPIVESNALDFFFPVPRGSCYRPVLLVTRVHAFTVRRAPPYSAGIHAPANNTGTIYIVNRHYILRKLPHWLIPNVRSGTTGIITGDRHC